MSSKSNEPGRRLAQSITRQQALWSLLIALPGTGLRSVKPLKRERFK
jgi:hypothetical protein